MVSQFQMVLTCTASSCKELKGNIRVFCRVRPSSEPHANDMVQLGVVCMQRAQGFKPDQKVGRQTIRVLALKV
eukprot:2661170-Amphidinium_carterae.1